MQGWGWGGKSHRLAHAADVWVAFESLLPCLSRLAGDAVTT